LYRPPARGADILKDGKMLNKLDTELAAKVVETLKANPDLGRTVTKARSVWKGGYRVETDVKDFKVIVDEPCAVGGSDSGPNPMALLLGAYGACFSIVFIFLATMKGHEIEKLELDLEGNIDVPAFLAIDETLGPEKAPGFTEIKSKVYIKSKAPMDELEKICARTASFSPVGQSLIRPVVVSTELSKRRLA